MRSRFSIPHGRADLCDHGAADLYPWWRIGGCVVFNLGYVTAERNVPDVPSDGWFPHCALTEADLQPRRRGTSVQILTPFPSLDRPAYTWTKQNQNDEPQEKKDRLHRRKPRAWPRAGRGARRAQLKSDGRRPRS